MENETFLSIPVSDWIAIIISGIGGTLVMSGFMYLVSFLTPFTLKVVKILGTMLTFRTTASGKLSDKPAVIWVGIVGHYAVGIVFVLVYYLLWQQGIGGPNYLSGIAYGVGSGLVAIIVWYSFFLIHPSPPAISLPSYLVSLFLAHFVFTYGAILTYQLVQAYQA